MLRNIFAIAALLVTGMAQAATLYVTEFTGSPPTFVAYQAARVPVVAEQTVAISGASTQSAAFNASTGLVRLHCDSVCNVLIGASPTVTTSSMRMAAGQTEYFVVTPGQKVAVIAGT
jgi:hypothetical protein